LLGEFCVEATTINPTFHVDGRPVPGPPAETQQERLLVVREYLPIRYAGPLTTKLAKRYWEHPHAADKPLVFAIQDFHEPMSMVWSRSALPIYLYGYDHDTRREPDGSLTIVPRRVRMSSTGHGCPWAPWRTECQYGWVSGYRRRPGPGSRSRFEVDLTVSRVA